MRRLNGGAPGRSLRRTTGAWAAAAFALVALAFLASRTGQALGDAPPPFAFGPVEFRPSAPGTRLEVPEGTRGVLALPSCGSCTLRGLPQGAIRASAMIRSLLVLEPERVLRKELRGARAEVWHGERALSLGPWASDGPVLLELAQDGTVTRVLTEQAEVASALARFDALYSEAQQ